MRIKPWPSKSLFNHANPCTITLAHNIVVASLSKYLSKDFINDWWLAHLAVQVRVLFLKIVRNFWIRWSLKEPVLDDL